MIIDRLAKFVNLSSLGRNRLQSIDGLFHQAMLVFRRLSSNENLFRSMFSIIFFTMTIHFRMFYRYEIISNSSSNPPRFLNKDPTCRLMNDPIVAIISRPSYVVESTRHKKRDHSVLIMLIQRLYSTARINVKKSELQTLTGERVFRIALIDLFQWSIREIIGQ